MRTEWMIPGSDSRRWTPRAVVTWGIFWAIVVGLCATPSWLISAATPFRQIAIAIGVVAGYALYLIITSTRWFANLLTDWRLRRTLKIGYGTRVAVSVIIPVGGIHDIFCGVMTSNLLGFESGGVGRSLVFTIAQAFMLHATLFVYILIVHRFVTIVGRAPDERVPRARGFEVLPQPGVADASTTITSEASAPPLRSAASRSPPASRA